MTAPPATGSQETGAAKSAARAPADPDVVVIGAGIGGLAAALRLAATGQRVRVYERHTHVGGKMRALPSVAGPVDAGPTVLTLRAVFDDLFAAAGAKLDEHVTLTRQDILARHFWPDGGRLDLFSDPERSAAAVRSFAGARGEAEFRRFSADTQRLFNAFDAPMMQAASPAMPRLMATVLRDPGLIRRMAPLSTLARHLARQFTDPRLAQLFGRYATYVGGMPARAPALLSLIWQAEARGVWKVEEGMHGLARAVADQIAGLGGAIVTGCGVEAIETGTDGAVRGVTLETGAMVRARAVVFNGDPRALATGLLGPAVVPAGRGTDRTGRSLSARVWSFAAAARGPAAPELAHHNVFFEADPVAEFADIAAGRMPARPNLYVCAEDRGGRDAPPETERFEIIVNAAPLTDATAPVQSDPEDVLCHRTTFPTLARFGLDFSPEPTRTALTTPEMFDQMFPASAGSLYGQSPHGMTAALARPRARTPVPGLYLAGGGTHPGAGVPMAALSGRHAAAAIAQDLALPSPSRPTAMPGGTWTGSATAAAGPSRSSGS